MSVGFFKRMFSSILDFALIMLVIYVLFVVGGRTILRNRVENFNERFPIYQEIINAYNDDISEIQTTYDADVTIANGDSALEAAALAKYNLRSELLNMQNTIDIRPYNDSLTPYYMEIIYFFSIGFIILMTILTIFTTGKTPGRKLLRIRLASEGIKGDFKDPSPIQVFFHDIVLKYFLIILVFTYSMYYGVILIIIALITDMLLISMTRNKTTIRDMFLKLKIVKSN